MAVIKDVCDLVGIQITTVKLTLSIRFDFSIKFGDLLKPHFLLITEFENLSKPYSLLITGFENLSKSSLLLILRISQKSPILLSLKMS